MRTWCPGHSRQTATIRPTSNRNTENIHGTRSQEFTWGWRTPPRDTFWISSVADMLRVHGFIMCVPLIVRLTTWAGYCSQTGYECRQWYTVRLFMLLENESNDINLKKRKKIWILVIIITTTLNAWKRNCRCEVLKRLLELYEIAYLRSFFSILFFALQPEGRSKESHNKRTRGNSKLWQRRRQHDEPCWRR